MTTSADLPAGFTHRTCFSVDCGSCRAPYEDNEGYDSVHFPTAAAAIAAATAAGWALAAGTLLCPQCACPTR